MSERPCYAENKSGLQGAQHSAYYHKKEAHNRGNLTWLSEYVKTNKDSGLIQYRMQKANSSSISRADIVTQPSAWLSSTNDSFPVTEKEY